MKTQQLPEGYDQLTLIEANHRSHVFRGRKNGQSVILKTVSQSNPPAAAIERLQREARMLQLVAPCAQVPHIVASAAVERRPFLTMTDLGPHTLRSLMADEPISLTRALDVLAALADAVAEVHKCGVVHKDLVPDNIVVHPELLPVAEKLARGEPQDEPAREPRTAGPIGIIDFSTAVKLSRQHAPAAPPSRLEGTLTHMSPEQTGRMGIGVDYRSDLYAIGVIAYQLFTGRLPYSASDPLGWCHCHLAEIPAPMREHRPELPDTLDAIVGKLMAKLPDERYQSAAGLSHDLRAVRAALDRGESLAGLALGACDRATDFRVPQRIYGRQIEIAALVRAYRDMADTGTAQVVLVGGQSGIGKTAIVNELQRPVVARRGIFLFGKCDQYRRDVAYDALLQAYRRHLRQVLAEDRPELLARWRGRLQRAVGVNGRVLTAVLPELTAIIGEQPTVPEVRPSETRNRFNQVFGDFTRALASSEAPLAIFIDDMQWADSATLELLPGLFVGEGMSHVCIVLAYRDNEVDGAHPFMLAVEELRRAGIAPLHLTVGPLPPSSVTALIGDALRAPDDDPTVGELAGEIMTKTAGNPFFVIHFIERMYRDGLLSQDPSGRWHCSADAVRQQQYTDNVVEMMVQRLQSLGADSQEILQLAACIGSHFELYSLCAASEETPQAIAEALWPAIEDGMVVPESSDHQRATTMSLADAAAEPVRYRFQHDRIQQAAYASLARDLRPHVHARIGRRWLASTSADQLPERLFAIVEQHNRGIEVIAKDAARADQHRRLAELNLQAGQRARSSGAFAVAKNYFAYGRTWLAHSDTDPALAFAMDLGYAECCYLTGDFDTALELTCEMTGRDVSISERKQLYVSILSLHITRGTLQDGFDAAMEFLASIAIVFPTISLEEAREHVYDDVAAALAGRPVRALETLSPPTDERVQAAMAILNLLFVPTVFLASPVMYQSLAKLVALSIEHGVNEDSIAGFGAFSYVLCDRRVARYHEAYELGLLAYDLAKAQDAKALLPSISMLFGSIASCYRSDLRNGRPLLYEALRVGQETGAYAFAGYASTHILSNMLLAGDHLDTVWKESERLLVFVKRVGDRNVERAIVTQQRLIEHLRGRTDRLGSLDGDGFKEADLAAAVLDTQMGAMIFWYYTHIMGARYLAGDWDGARAAMDRASSMLYNNLSSMDQTLYFFYSALLLAQLYASTDDLESRAEYLQTMDACMAQNRVWAESAPMSFAGRQALMEAERARVTGDVQGATEGYNRAIGEFREQRFGHHMALALERAGEHYRQQGLDEVGAVFLGDALARYRDWGAHGKVAWLAERYPAIAGPLLGPSAALTQSIGGDKLDLASLLEASQALSRAVRLDDLVRRLLEIVRENAGAQCAYLILLRKDGAHQLLDGETTRTLRDGDDSADVAAPIVELARLSGEPVLLSDARSDEGFRDNPVLRAHGVRSLLCLPLEWAGEVRGLLYLDNRTTPAVFTPGRVALLRSLAQQAGISVENAELYGDLERRVEERTRELRETRREMVDMAYAAGMAQTAASTLHNLGNALNGVNLKAVFLRDDLLALPTRSLERLAKELRRRQPDDRQFFSKLPPFVAELSADMERRRTSLVQDTETLCSLVDDVVYILKQQRRHSSQGARLRELSSMRQLLEDALELSGVASDIEIVRDHGDEVPKVYDRPLILQIVGNLITNACNAMNARADSTERILTLRISQDESETTLAVADTGVGFAPEIANHLFRQGFTTRADGSGLGLHSAAIQARSMGARLLAHSDGPGRGATFTLIVPHGDDAIGIVPHGDDSAIGDGGSL